MPVTLVNPEGTPAAETHHQVAIAVGSRTIYLAGQVAWDATGTLVGVGDLGAQITQCLRNVATALGGVGATFDDVAKLTIYVVDWSIDKYPEVLQGMAKAFEDLSITARPPASLLAISAGFTSDILAEIEAIAVLD